MDEAERLSLLKEKSNRSRDRRHVVMMSATGDEIPLQSVPPNEGRVSDPGQPL
jgi:hypothetical protein